MADWKRVREKAAPHWMAGAGFVLDVGVGLSEGKGVVGSVVKAGVDFGISEFAGALVGPTLMMWTQVGNMAIQAGGAYLDHGRGTSRKVSSLANSNGKVGHGFQDSQNAQMMRQRGLQAMSNNSSVLNGAMGSEARRRAYNIRY